VGSDGASFTATTARDGQYTIEGLPTDTYTLIADASGFARTFFATVNVTTGIIVIPIQMARESVITGSVSLASGGSAEGSPHVEAHPDGVTDPYQTYYGSVTNGAFSLDGLPAGSYDLSLTLPGYLPAALTGVVVVAGATVNVGSVVLSQDPPGQGIDVVSGGQDVGTITVQRYTGWMSDATGKNYTPINPYTDSGYSDRMQPNWDGAYINVVFQPSVGLEDSSFQYQWVQAVVAGQGDTNGSPPYLDPFFRDDNLPYYWTSAETSVSISGRA
jgi:hypothetical protein